MDKKTLFFVIGIALVSTIFIIGLIRAVSLQHTIVTIENTNETYTVYSADDFEHGKITKLDAANVPAPNLTEHELIEYRTANSQTFQGADGKRYTIIHSTDIFYFNGSSYELKEELNG